MQLKGAEIMCKTLLQLGVDVLFGHPGGAILPFYDALWAYPQLRHILVRHEQAAAHAADGYSRITGRVGVCVATSGPGATNLITGIMGAKADSVPLVAITGQVARTALGSEAFQECDICSIAAACTKKAFLVMAAADLAPTLHEAFHIAQEGRPGPVLVDVPRDVQLELTDYIPEEPLPAPDLTLSRDTLEGIKHAARLINEAERPLIIGGHGIVSSGATEELKALAEATGIPVITTLLGLSGFPGDHPLNLGMLGMHGMYWSNIAVDQADLLVGLAMRFDDRVTGRASTFAPHARIIHLDIEASQVGRNVPVEVPLVGDAKTILKELLPHVKHVDRPAWMDNIGQLRQDHPSLEIPASENLMPQHVLTNLNQLLQEEPESVVVTGVGQHQMWAAQFLFFNSVNTFVSSGGQGAMGFELPAAMGVQAGRPGTPVWTVAGDGGFQMTMCELATIAQEKININVAIINNGYLGMVRQWQEFFYERRYAATPLLSPDFAKLAECFGLTGIVVDKRQDVVPAIESARADDGTVVVEFKVEQEDTVYPMVPAGADLHDMIRRPSLAPIVETASDE